MSVDYEELSRKSEILEHGQRTDRILRIQGSTVILQLFPEAGVRYGDKLPKGEKMLGRASQASEEDQALNAVRVGRRRQKTVIMLANCNEHLLPGWLTLTYAGEQKDVSVFAEDRGLFQRRAANFLRTGILNGRKLERFRPNERFRYTSLGVIEFQDGQRTYNGEGTGNVHGHEMNNIDFCPWVFTILCEKLDPATNQSKNMYLQKDGALSPVADSNTIWFELERDAKKFVRRNPWIKKSQKVVGVRSKGISALQILWGKGNVRYESIGSMRAEGRLISAGRYLAKYMAKNAFDPRLRGVKGFYHTGALLTEEVFRDKDAVVSGLLQMGLLEGRKLEVEHLVSIAAYEHEWLGTVIQFEWSLWDLPPQTKEYVRERVINKYWRHKDLIDFWAEDLVLFVDLDNLSTAITNFP